MARALSVEFDEVCAKALSGVAEAAPEVAREKTADEIHREIQAAVLMVRRDALERMQRPGWQKEFTWRKMGLEGHRQGKMPPGIQMHPAVAGAALRELEAVERGDVQSLDGIATDEPLARARQYLAVPAAGAGPSANASTSTGRASHQEAAEALERYCAGVSIARGQKARGTLKAALSFPAGPSEVQAQIEAYCTWKLAEGLKPASVRTNLQCLRAMLQELPGFEDVDLPKRSPVRKALKGAGGLSSSAREPVAPAVLANVLTKLDEAGDAESAAAVRLLSRYGMRPSELFRAFPSDIREHRDVMGGVCTVFVAGERLRKTDGSRRLLPIHLDDLPLFKLVLGGLNLPDDCSDRKLEARGAARSLALTNTFIAAAQGAGVMYGLRHLFADLARAVGASDQEVGGLLGHQNRGGRMTAIYGGSQPLTRAAEILQKVREALGAER